LATSVGKDGHRVNAISAGPIKTLAASGVKNFRKMLSYNAGRAPLGRNVTTEEVGNTASFLSSDLASGITGELIYVDAGFNVTAMGSIEETES
jgi:enoyl-[acyl-carrier protein] reductase I